MPQPEPIASRVVSDVLQESFAQFSGDRNPMHMDPIAARRTQAGFPVVHGVHTLLWALESLVVSGFICSRLLSIRARFLKWVYIGDEAVLRPSAGTSVPYAFQVEVLGLPVLSAELVYGEPAAFSPKPSLPASPKTPLLSALDLAFADLENRSGNAYTATAEESKLRFPELSALIGPVAVSEIAACSYVVGMEVPGLHSMFSRLDIDLVRPDPSSSDERSGLHYEVTSHDERFAKARVAVRGSCITGNLGVFMRSRPVQQSTIESIASRVGASEFAGVRALIIGGSRGLGELTAKLIAAGGGSTTITYAVGKSEAEKLVEQIRAFGSTAHMFPYDIRQSPRDQVSQLPELPTHLFYFATSTIYKPKLALLSESTLAEFINFYVHGFYALCTTLLEKRVSTLADPRPLFVMYPSTIFLEERPVGMTEYAMVKAAGEQLCKDMNAYLPGIHIVVPRLPKLSTDQTAGVLPERQCGTVDALLPVLRNILAL